MDGREYECLLPGSIVADSISSVPRGVASSACPENEVGGGAHHCPAGDAAIRQKPRTGEGKMGVEEPLCDYARCEGMGVEADITLAGFARPRRGSI